MAERRLQRMPIHKRDRNFQNIVSELDIRSVPTEFVQQVTLICENSDRITFEDDTIQGFREEKDFVSAMIHLVEDNSDVKSPVIDVEIVIDYKKLEKIVNSKTEALFKK